MKKIYCGFLLILMAVSVLAGPKDKEKKQMKPVLIVMDIQNQFLPYMSDEDNKFALEMINAAIGLFRQHNYPVIRIYHTSPEWGPKPGTKPFEFPENIKIKDDDPKIIKNYPSGFQDTELDSLLQAEGLNTVYISGLSAVGCALATYFGAMERGYNVFMIKDTLLSHDATLTNSVEEITEANSLSTIKFILEHANE